MIKSTALKGTTALRALAITGALLAPTFAFAEDVTLKSADGTVNIVGEFMGFEENAYLIKTGLGDLRISAERVRCEGEACPVFETATADVVIAGSETIGLGMMPLLLEGYAAFNDADSTVTSTVNVGEIIAEMIGDQGFGDPMGSFLVSSTNSNDAFQALMKKESEIGMASRRITPDEARALKKDGAGNMISPSQEHIVAVDSLVVIVNPENSVQELTTQQVADIFAGKITNWKDLGGTDAEIKLYDREEGSDTRSVFQKAVNRGEEAPVAASATVITDSTEMAIAVNADPHAIGYVSYAFQRGAKALPLVNECGITMTPDAFSARTEEYALQRRLYLYNRDDAISDTSKALLDFAKSTDADDVIQKAGFISLGIDQVEQTADSNRARTLLAGDYDAYEGSLVQDMLGMMSDYDRLSSTFRFRSGSSRLDERARLDMARLADFLEQSPKGTEVLFVGFTDDVGAFDSNRDLSKRRANSVMQQMVDAAGTRLEGIKLASAGYGEIAPSACNSSENGRGINRRVEVWISVPTNS
ncbi:phosphate ABC transporter substrate-binding/OmpA family protein [uncultured Tateyamaria sp.]|uniref:phosphate ABC transporter substrate-binding/OmpA family protein n=1 Tax=uncultured Tateyamaria sp. TaxID=455651 RepID=UPI00262C55D4|nr:phosphate ABC transporter substrate-binding/OmpA family protein [uncultured Tateyamaria sp.]